MMEIRTMISITVFSKELGVTKGGIFGCEIISLFCVFQNQSLDNEKIKYKDRFFSSSPMNEQMLPQSD